MLNIGDEWGVFQARNFKYSIFDIQHLIFDIQYLISNIFSNIRNGKGGNLVDLITVTNLVDLITVTNLQIWLIWQIWEMCYKLALAES